MPFTFYFFGSLRRCATTSVTWFCVRPVCRKTCGYFLWSVPRAIVSNNWASVSPVIAVRRSGRPWKVLAAFVLPAPSMPWQLAHRALYSSAPLWPAARQETASIRIRTVRVLLNRFPIITPVLLSPQRPSRAALLDATGTLIAERASLGSLEHEYNDESHPVNPKVTVTRHRQQRHAAEIPHAY